MLWSIQSTTTSTQFLLQIKKTMLLIFKELGTEKRRLVMDFTHLKSIIVLVILIKNSKRIIDFRREYVLVIIN